MMTLVPSAKTLYLSHSTLVIALELYYSLAYNQSSDIPYVITKEPYSGLPNQVNFRHLVCLTACIFVRRKSD